MSDTLQLRLDEVQELARAACEANGCSAEQARAIADTVTAAERDQCHSHGLFRIPFFVRAMRESGVSPQAEPRLEELAPSVLRIDGGLGFAPLVLETGCNALIERTREQGIAALCLTNVFHISALWPEVERLADAGLVGFAFTGAIDYVAPAGGSKPLYGTNPMAFAWPRNGKPPIVFDQASAASARGEIQVIGSTTPDEYRKQIEKDSALERRFQSIMIHPSTRDESVEILKGLRDRYEAHHCVQITDRAIDKAVDFANRYITDRFMPDKALDVIDEAGSLVRLRSMSSPPDVKNLEEEAEKLNLQKDEAITEQDFERAAQLRDRIKQIEKQKQEHLQEQANQAPEAYGAVTEDDVREVVSSMTGVPLTRLQEEEAERLLKMEDKIHERVVDQHEAVSAVSRAIRRSRSGLKDPRRPVASFMFIGPTGVGKTLLARALSDFLFGSEDSLIQLDMSEYMEKHNVSRLVGAPPGYVGYEEGGQLTEKIRRQSYAVVLLDEIEKAHPEVFNMLLQIMEDGRLTDNYGRNVDFSNVVLIMTSNIGADIIKDSAGMGFRKQTEEMDYETMKKQLQEQVEQHFKPEFLNRIDETIVFRNLTREHLQEIVKLEVDEVRERLRAQDKEMELTEAATEFLIDKGYNPQFGARPLRRAIEQHLEDPLSEEILKGKYEDTERILVDKGDEDSLTFSAADNDKESGEEETSDQEVPHQASTS